MGAAGGGARAGGRRRGGGGGYEFVFPVELPGSTQQMQVRWNRGEDHGAGQSKAVGRQRHLEERRGFACLKTVPVSINLPFFIK